MSDSEKLLALVCRKTNQLTRENLPKRFTVLARCYLEYVSIGEARAIENETEVVAFSDGNVDPLEWLFAWDQCLSLAHRLPGNLCRC